MLLGVLYAKDKQRQPALTKFKRVLELNPLLSDAWIAQAQVRVKTLMSLFLPFLEQTWHVLCTAPQVLCTLLAHTGICIVALPWEACRWAVGFYPTYSVPVVPLYP